MLLFEQLGWNASCALGAKKETINYDEKKILLAFVDIRLSGIEKME